MLNRPTPHSWSADDDAKLVFAIEAKDNYTDIFALFPGIQEAHIEDRVRMLGLGIDKDIKPINHAILEQIAPFCGDKRLKPHEKISKVRVLMPHATLARIKSAISYARKNAPREAPDLSLDQFLILEADIKKISKLVKENKGLVPDDAVLASRIPAKHPYLLRLYAWMSKLGVDVAKLRACYQDDQWTDEENHCLEELLSTHCSIMSISKKFPNKTAPACLAHAWFHNWPISEDSISALWRYEELIVLRKLAEAHTSKDEVDFVFRGSRHKDVSNQFKQFQRDISRKLLAEDFVVSLKPKQWSLDEMEILRTHCEHMSTAELMALLPGRSASNIRRQAKSAGLSILKHTGALRYSEQDKLRMKDAILAGKRVEQIEIEFANDPSELSVSNLYNQIKRELRAAGFSIPRISRCKTTQQVQQTSSAAS